MIELVSEERLEAIVEDTMRYGNLLEDEYPLADMPFRLGVACARAVLKELGVVRVVDVPPDLHDDFLMWKELREGAVLVRVKPEEDE